MPATKTPTRYALTYCHILKRYDVKRLGNPLGDYGMFEHALVVTTSKAAMVREIKKRRDLKVRWFEILR
ncbi:MAG: hypothetical protein ACYS7Y_04240 [Planctomycetota bacterium]|jgi:hypothetical protein